MTISLPNAACDFGVALGKDRKKRPHSPARMQETLFVWDLDKVLAKRACSLAAEEGLPYM